MIEYGPYIYNWENMFGDVVHLTKCSFVSFTISP